VRVKFVLLGGGEKAVEVVGQEQFGLFTSPVHKAPSERSSSRAVGQQTSNCPIANSRGSHPICCRMRANSMRPRLILDFTVLQAPRETL